MSVFLIVITYFFYNFLDIYQSKSIFEQNLEERMIVTSSSQSAEKFLSDQSFSDTQNHYTFLNENGYLYLLRINIDQNTLTIYDLNSIPDKPLLVSETTLE